MTYDSIGKCLPNRTNLVLSHNAVLFQSTPDCKVVCSIEEALFSAARFKSKEAFIIGGASTYQQFAPLVDRYLITVVEKDVPDADAFLSETVFGDPDNWIKNTLGEFPASPGVDEAPFAIYEWVAKDAKDRQVHRNAAIDDFTRRNHLIRNPTKISSSDVSKLAPASMQLQL